MPRHHVVRWSLRVAAMASLAAWLVTIRWTAFIHDRAGAAVGVSCGVVFWSDCDLPPNNIFVPGPVIYSHPPGRWWMSERVGPLRWRPEWVEWPSVTMVSLPLWMLLVACAVLDVVVGVRVRRRASAGRCRACGYERRGLGTAALCPECGEAPALGPAARDAHTLPHG